MVAEGATYPLDFTKTRLQLHGEAGFPSGGPKLSSLTGMMTHIVKTEGVTGLYSGFSPALARHIPYTGFRAIGYEVSAPAPCAASRRVGGPLPASSQRALSPVVRQHIRRFFCGNDSLEAPFFAKAAAAMVAGGTGQAIAAPLDLIKVRMQGDGRLVAAKKLAKPRYSGLVDALVTIARREGPLGFYAGCAPAVQRACLVNMGELTTYDSAKNAIVENVGFARDDMRCHLLAATCSGFVASLFSTPADVAKSRIMNQKARPYGGELQYAGLVDCWATTVKREGVLALYKGFLPGWIRLAPWQLIFWVTYERLRILAGVGSFK
ncbi:hypothetical protein KFE25_010358 [Diacronema lutheri]|uniref:Mitochondrial uncoupling protein 4 n=1 Tax=Diacronema lutheri TaxID=2081491 RepID=A0A8J6CCI8_DIALT|nr:hypothetical protein KFE25_010358 [Diacronema lutheri]